MPGLCTTEPHQAEGLQVKLPWLKDYLGSWPNTVPLEVQKHDKETFEKLAKAITFHVCDSGQVRWTQFILLDDKGGVVRLVPESDGRHGAPRHSVGDTITSLKEADPKVVYILELHSQAEQSQSRCLTVARVHVPPADKDFRSMEIDRRAEDSNRLELVLPS